jgi:hypothetical protein
MPARPLLARRAAAALPLLLWPGAGNAAQYVVHVHGRGQNGWGDNPMYAAPGWQAVGVAYNATTATLAQANAQLRPQLATYCAGANACILVAYSNGALQVGYTQANYPEALENALYVEAGGSAAGGTDLLNDWTSEVASWFGQSYPAGVDATLTVSAARNAYNHSLSAGIPTYHLGANTDWTDKLFWATAALLPGNDDGAVAFHSAFGCAVAGSQKETCGRFAGHFLDQWAVASGDARSCPSGVCKSIDHGEIDDRAAYWY